MSDYPMLISNKLHSFRNFIFTKLLIFCINSRFSSKQNYKRRKFKTHIKKRGNNERALG